MPIPSNLTPGTALDITTLPYSFTISAADVTLAPTGSGYSTCDANERHELWWKITTSATDTLLLIGVSGISNNAPPSNYQPHASLWIGTPPAVTMLSFEVLPGIFQNYCATLSTNTAPNVLNSWFRFPVTPNTTYYLQVVALNAGVVDVDLTVVADTYPNSTYDPGDFVIQDDTNTYPGISINPITGATKSTLPISGSGETGATLTGRMAIFNSNYPLGGGLFGRGEIYNTADMSLVAGFTPSAGNHRHVAWDADSNYFYNYGYDAINNYIDKVDRNGNIIHTYTIPIATMDFSGNFNAINREGTIIYVVDVNIAQTTVKRWDLVNNVALPDFFTVSNPAQEQIHLLGVSFNGNIVICVHNFITGVVQSYMYNPSGALVSSVPDLGYFIHRFFMDITANNFFTWDGGLIFRTHSLPSFAETSINGEGVTVTSSMMTSFISDPTHFFYSDSCPLIVLPPLEIPPMPPNPGSGLYKLVPNKRQDTIYNDDLTATFDVKIP